MYKRSRFLLPGILLTGLFLLLLSSLVQRAHAAPQGVITVNSADDVMADDDRCTLREAIINANQDDQSGSDDCDAGNGADTILFDNSLSSSTIVLTLGQLLITDTLSIYGLGQNNLTLDGNGTSRIFSIQGTITNTFDALVQDMRVTDGSHAIASEFDGGGGINAIRVNLTLRNMQIDNNEISGMGVLPKGGGVSIVGGSFYLINVTISDNQAKGYLGAVQTGASGGGVHFQATSGTLQNVIINGNQAQGASAAGNGGGMSTYGGVIVVEGSHIYGNQSLTLDGLTFGGGISASSGGHLTLRDSTVYDNIVTGVYTDNASYLVSNSGAGIYANAGFLELHNTDVTSNTAVGGPRLRPNAGGLFMTGAELQAIDTTIRGNVVMTTAGTGAGGGLYAIRTDVALTNTIISENAANNGGGVRLFTENDLIDMCESQGDLFIGGIIENNRASESGGGIYTNSDGYFNCYHRLENVTIRGNQAADDGGGLYAENNSVFLLNSKVLSNTAHWGAGVYIGTTGFGNPIQSRIDSTEIAYNQGTNFGSGLYNDSIDLLVRQSRIHNNSTTWRGGGIAHQGGLLYVNTTGIYSNTASFGGGILYQGTTGDNLRLLQSSVAYNTSTSPGAAIYHWSGPDAQIANTTFSHNDAGSIASIYVRNGDLTFTNVTVSNGVGDATAINVNSSLGGVMTMTNSIVDNNFADACLSPVTNLTGPNLIADTSCGAPSIQAAANLGPLQINDGGYSTLSHVPNAGSPALGNGDNAICATGFVNGGDQRAWSRSDGACDLGAIEKLACNSPAAADFSLTRDGTDMVLDWPAYSTPFFEIHRETQPYFTPITPVGYGQIGFTDSDVLSSEMVGIYTVLGRNDCGQTSAVQYRRGFFGFTITPGN